MLDAELPIVLAQLIGRCQTHFQMAIARLSGRKGFELYEQRWNQVERELERRELACQRRHPVVVLERMQPHPRLEVLAGGEVLIEGLVHVPQQSDARHNGPGP